MSPKLRTASTIAVAATFITALFSAHGSGATAQDRVPQAVNQEPSPAFIAEPVIQQVPETAPESEAPESAPLTASSLAELVAAQPVPQDLPREIECLAAATYFEAKSESLAGQLAVARVVVARSKSGRFPDSYCGVVFQPSQFSFVRGGALPRNDRSSRDWREAVAIAQIAHAGAWRSPVEGALFFHATHVSPRWRLNRIATVDNHVFYR